jgi:hypothetical protein
LWLEWKVKELGDKEAESFIHTINEIQTISRYKNTIVKFVNRCIHIIKITTELIVVIVIISFRLNPPVNREMCPNNMKFDWNASKV